MRTRQTLLAAALLASVSTAAMAFPFPNIARAVGAGDNVSAQERWTDITDGIVRKVDKDAKTLTIRHADVHNEDMPSMTMQFEVKDAAMLDLVQAGDRVRFKAEKVDDKLTVTELRVHK